MGLAAVDEQLDAVNEARSIRCKKDRGVGDLLRTAHASQRHARQVLTRVENTSINQVFASGLHEVITAFVDDNNRLGVEIADQYLVN